MVIDENNVMLVKYVKEWDESCFSVHKELDTYTPLWLDRVSKSYNPEYLDDFDIPCYAEEYSGKKRIEILSKGLVSWK